ncbi:MAG: bifunctional [glutamate--ammonia ligase]-adenylyl-L-tyrosine phosphorylase/[glutamate--ammonia-ligase] adenylyltransferase [Polyangiaceae bacterium]|nr:bifunctional [glutamate--ammonia ligase]-adenylyl-L-tyrosine phosphorylase/[glutamate--ammonia-ligase] adenylyltransferase [Polyangiaceae bacterium]
MPPTFALLDLARRIDPERVDALSDEFSASPSCGLAVVLAACLPAMTPDVPWKLAALEMLQSEDLAVPRRASGMSVRLLEALQNGGDERTQLSLLRRSVWAEKARIALREILPVELGGATVETTAAELSRLAEALLQVVLQHVKASLSPRLIQPVQRSGVVSELVVFGMGKLGGDELNAGSDIDLIFFYDADEADGPLSAHEYWTRVVRRVVAIIDESTEDGRLWRVDLRLRPEGSLGPLVNSIAAADRYYETWGRLWERSALLRSRAIAGDPSLAEVLEREVILPFVFRREVDPGVATALAEMLQRSRAELSRDAARDLKLGPGGIREAEFFIQSLQLIWGGRELSLRVPGSLPALQRLRALGLVSDKEANDVSTAYLFLRTVEHRIQWMSGLQTHLLPESPGELLRLARGLNFESVESFRLAVADARTRVSESFASLLPQAPRPPTRHLELFAKLDEGAGDLAQTCADLFGDPEVADHLTALARRPDGLLGQLTRERLLDVPDQVLDALVQCANPPQAAVLLRAFFARFQSPLSYLLSLRRDPLSLRRLVRMLGASEFVGRAVAMHPDLADTVMFGGGRVTGPGVAIAAELDQAQILPPEAPDAYERRSEFVSALRRAKQRTMVEVAVSDLGGQLSLRQMTRVLSELAEEQLRAALEFELGQPVRGLAVIAVGKLGGRDIGYASDLDVLFIFDPACAPPGQDPTEFFVKRAQRVIRLVSDPDPSGPGYELDTRLRPSGSQGMLVTSLESFARYHGVDLGSVRPGGAQPAVLSSGASWERLALIRARFCAGDAALGGRVMQVAERAAYDLGPPSVEEIHHLRGRMQRELGRETASRFDFKVGRGGLLDVEFAAQWLQMAHGRDVHIRTPDTNLALRRLRDAGYLARHHYEALREGYRFLRFLEQRTHVHSGQSSCAIDVRDPYKLTQLARRMEFHTGPGLSKGSELLLRYRAVTGSVRQAYLEVLGVSEVPFGGAK